MARTRRQIDLAAGLGLAVTVSGPNLAVHPAAAGIANGGGICASNARVAAASAMERILRNGDLTAIGRHAITISPACSAGGYTTTGLYAASLCIG